MLNSLSLLLTAALLAACASGPGGPPRDRNRITEEEISEVQVGSALEIIERLRPEFLRSRGRSSIRNANADFAVVYVDGVRIGGINQLRSVSRDVVIEIRYLSASDATTIYGTGHSGGAILVRTRR